MRELLEPLKKRENAYTYTGDGLPSVSSSTPSVCAASDSTVYYLSAGTCTLQAIAPATVDYAATIGSAQSFIVNSPTILTLSPAAGPEATLVTISGLGFGLSPATTTVTFNGTPANLSGWGNTSIVTKVPIGATTGNVVVTANGTASNGVMRGIGGHDTYSLLDWFAWRVSREFSLPVMRIM